MTEKKFKIFGLTIIVLLSLLLLKDITDSRVFNTLMKILTPFLYGFIIAYFLNPIIEFTYRRFNFSRLLVVVIVYIIMLLLIYFSFKFLIPIVVSNLKFFIRDLPNSINKLAIIIDQKFLSNISPEYSREISKQFDELLHSIGRGGLNFGMLLHYTKYATDFLMNMAIGIVVSIYMIKDKHRLIVLSKKLIYSYLDIGLASSIVNFLSELNQVFYRFLIGKIIDSSIMGVLFYIALLFIDMPYTIVMSLIFGLTNIIPYFGPLLGIVICTVIAIIYAPEYAIIVLIITFLLQQFDGFYLGPKILGDRVGLSPFWTMATILVAGGLFGVSGMLLAVPTASIMKTMLIKSMDKRLEKKNLIIK